MPVVWFRQYLRPDGRTKTIGMDRPYDISMKAAEIVKKGYRLEAEVLTAGDVSLTIHDTNSSEDVDIVLATNDTEVPDAVDRLIGGFVILEGR